MSPVRPKAVSTRPEHLHRDVPIYAACGNELVHWYEFIRLVCPGEQARPDHRAACTHRVEVHEIASAFEAERPASGAIPTTGLDTGSYDRMIRWRLGRSSRRWLIAD